MIRALVAAIGEQLLADARFALARAARAQCETLVLRAVDFARLLPRVPGFLAGCGCDDMDPDWCSNGDVFRATRCACPCHHIDARVDPFVVRLYGVPFEEPRRYAIAPEARRSPPLRYECDLGDPEAAS